MSTDASDKDATVLAKRPRLVGARRFPHNLPRLCSPWLDVDDLVALSFACKDVRRHMHGVPMDLFGYDLYCEEDYVHHPPPWLSFWKITGLSVDIHSDSDLMNKIAWSTLIKLRVMLTVGMMTLSSVLKKCPRIQALSITHGMTSYQRHYNSDFKNNWSIVTITNTNDFSACANLKSLNLANSHTLICTRGLVDCHALETLNLSFCTALTDVEDLGDCVALKNLTLMGCSNLLDVVGLEKCMALETLDLTLCHKLTTVGLLGSSPSLQSLNLSTNVNLSDICSLESCKTLRFLNVQDCPKLQQFTEMSDRCQVLR
jgi:Leucine-rich repeat (LRR) protein